MSNAADKGYVVDLVSIEGCQRAATWNQPRFDSEDGPGVQQRLRHCQIQEILAAVASVVEDHQPALYLALQHEFYTLPDSVPRFR